MKKLILIVIVLLLISGGFFYWWQGHADERELNKTLPEGIRVDKCLLTGEYMVINEIDGYEFKVPTEWKGLDIIEYLPERTEEGFTAASISIEGKEGSGRIVTIDKFRIENLDQVDLKSWAENNFETFGLVGNFSEDRVGNFEIVKTQENVHLGGMWVYFFQKDSAVYAITCGSEELNN